MRLICISDTHGLHADLQLPDGDLLLHAGDLSKRGTREQLTDFFSWFEAQPHPYKVCIAGNHDFLAENHPNAFQQMIPDNCTYLEDSGVEIEGIRIWGSPITPWFFDWAFNRRRGAEIRKYWEQIPANTDILLTHGPPLGAGDMTFHGQAAGCKDLREIIELHQPRFHFFGHIHEAVGESLIGATRCINVCSVNLKYQLVHEPVVIDW
ncbi:MAG: metallophosphoesterase family protein [Bacteroidota bacterium]